LGFLVTQQHRPRLLSFGAPCPVPLRSPSDPLFPWPTFLRTGIFTLSLDPRLHPPVFRHTLPNPIQTNGRVQLTWHRSATPALPPSFDGPVRSTENPVSAVFPTADRPFIFSLLTAGQPRFSEPFPDLPPYLLPSAKSAYLPRRQTFYPRHSTAIAMVVTY